MLNLKYIFFVIQLLILVTEIKSEQMFFRGKDFNDDFQKTESRAGISLRGEWYMQVLDHFNHSKTKRWMQRYYVNEEYCKDYKNKTKYPVFLMVGGEVAVSSNSMTEGFWVERAKQHGALLVQLEHRFYGNSHPTEDATIENLQYLTVEQALEDIVSFMAFVKKIYKMDKSNKWILFGASYAGNLVAWLRLKYPQLVYGAVSSSAPVESVVDYKDYFKIVAESLLTYSSDCVTTITEAFANIDQLSQDATGQQTLTSKFNLCDALENSKDFVNDFAQLNNALANNIAEVVEYNKVDHSSNETIDNICNILTNRTLGATSLDRFAALIQILQYHEECFEYNYQNFVNSFKTTSWSTDPNKGGRQWFFQTCNQLGDFPSSSSIPHVFGNKFPVEHFIKQCTDVFGQQYNAEFIAERTNTINKDYGGKGIVNKVDRVVFVQGSIDPCHALGVDYSFNKKSPAIYIIGTAHCADMESSSSQDLPQLMLARKVITSYINYWLF